MRSIRVCAALSLAAVLSGCNAREAPAPAAKAPAAASPVAPTPILELKQLMEWVIDPAADVIWDAVKTVSTEAGTREIAPQNEEQWNAVRNAGATLVESSNLLLVTGRARDDKAWANFARGLVKTGTAAMKAAQAKNKDALFDAGGELYVVCRGCHEAFAKHLNSSNDAGGGPFMLRQAQHERLWLRQAQHERSPREGPLLMAQHRRDALP